MTPPLDQDRPRIEALTFTRFVAAAAIVVFHFGRKAAPFDGELMGALVKKGYVGVSYFFILSGFVMIVAYGHKDRVAVRPYLRNRFARIYPVYVLAIAMLFCVRSLQSQAIDWTGVGLNLLLVQAWIPDYAHSFNMPGWSLSCEMAFYAAFPWLYNSVYRRFYLRRVGIAALVLWAVSQVVFHALLWSPLYGGLHSTGHNAILYFPLMHFNQFILGNIVGLLYLQRRGAGRGNHDLALVALVAAVAVVPPLITAVNWHNGLLAILFVPAILLTAANTGPIARVSSLRPFVFLGEISYGIYILQLPVFEGCEVAFDRWGLEDPSLRFYAFALVLLAISVLSYIALEAPLRRWIKSRGTRAPS